MSLNMNEGYLWKSFRHYELLLDIVLLAKELVNLKVMYHTPNGSGKLNFSFLDLSCIGK